MDDRTAHAATIREHSAWLAQIDVDLAKNWQRRLLSDPEGAISEAILRDELLSRVSEIEPAEDVSSGGLDFLCRQGRQEFYVECTCLTRNAVSRKTSLPNLPGQGAQSYSLLTDVFQNTIREKGKQLGKYSGTSRVLAICTLHFSAGSLCFSKNAAEFVLAKPQIAWQVDTRTGEKIGDTFEISDLKKAAFLKPGTGFEPRPVPVRQYVSAVLLCGFGGIPRSICGILNSDASVEFERKLLPDIEFCRQIYDARGTSVLWV